MLVLKGNITVAITNEINLNRKIISHPLHCAHAQTHCYLHSDVEVTHLACKYTCITARQRSMCLAAVSDQYIISSVLFLQSPFFPACISTFRPSTASTPNCTHFHQSYTFFFISCLIDSYQATVLKQHTDENVKMEGSKR